MDLGLSTGAWATYKGYIPEEKRRSVLEEPWSVNSPSARGGTLQTLPPFMVDHWLTFPTHNHSSCELMSVTGLCTENSVFTAVLLWYRVPSWPRSLLFLIRVSWWALQIQPPPFLQCWGPGMASFCMKAEDYDLVPHSCHLLSPLPT